MLQTVPLEIDFFFLNQYTAKKNKENTAKQVDSDKKHTTTCNIYANNR